ncbi:hypothetical protein GCM10027295_02360 [Pseudaeromonas pectinilytica]
MNMKITRQKNGSSGDPLGGYRSIKNWKWGFLQINHGQEMIGWIELIIYIATTATSSGIA